jgi:hypothetical protein
VLNYPGATICEFLTISSQRVSGGDYRPATIWVAACENHAFGLEVRNRAPTLPRPAATTSVFQRIEAYLLRRGGLLNLLQPVLQQFLFPQIFRHGNGASDLVTRLSESPHLHQQISANAWKEVVAG